MHAHHAQLGMLCRRGGLYKCSAYWSFVAWASAPASMHYALRNDSPVEISASAQWYTAPVLQLSPTTSCCDYATHTKNMRATEVTYFCLTTKVW